MRCVLDLTSWMGCQHSKADRWPLLDLVLSKGEHLEPVHLDHASHTSLSGILILSSIFYLFPLLWCDFLPRMFSRLVRFVFWFWTGTLLYSTRSLSTTLPLWLQGVAIFLGRYLRSQTWTHTKLSKKNSFTMPLINLFWRGIFSHPSQNGKNISVNLQICRKIRGLGCVTRALVLAWFTQPSPRIFLLICSDCSCMNPWLPSLGRWVRAQQ